MSGFVETDAQQVGMTGNVGVAAVAVADAAPAPDCVRPLPPATVVEVVVVGATVVVGPVATVVGGA